MKQLSHAQMDLTAKFARIKVHQLEQLETADVNVPLTASLVPIAKQQTLVWDRMLMESLAQMEVMGRLEQMDVFVVVLELVILVPIVMLL